MKLFTASLAVFLTLGLQTAEAPAQADGKWVKLAPFPEPAEELYGIAAGGKMYVFGGRHRHGSREHSFSSTILRQISGPRRSPWPCRPITLRSRN